MKHKESELQRRCVKWFRIKYPYWRALLFAVPNGGARSTVEAGIMKAEGVTSGVSDLIFILPTHKHNILCIEMKNNTSTSRLSKAQKEWGEIAELWGARYEVVRTFERFVEVVEDYINERTFKEWQKKQVN